MQPETKTVKRIREIWFVTEDTYDLRRYLSGERPDDDDDKRRFEALQRFQKQQRVTLLKPVFADALLQPVERVALSLAPRSPKSDHQLASALSRVGPTLSVQDPRVARFADRLASSSRAAGLRLARRLRRSVPLLHPFYRLRLIEERAAASGASDKEREQRPDPIALLRQLPGVRAAYDLPLAVRDGAPLSPNDPWFDPPGGLAVSLGSPMKPKLRDQWNVRLINAPAAWSFTTGEGVTVGVIDSGVDQRHPDLRGQLDPRSDRIVLDVPGKPGRKDPHGTLVAGIIAARSNDEGICGVAPDAKILSFAFGEPDPPERRGQKSPAPEPSDWIAGIVRAARAGAKVINCSWHLEVPCCREDETDLVMDALRRAILVAMEEGATVVCSMGNRSQYNTPQPYESWPAALNGTTHKGTELVVVAVGGVGFPLPGQALSRFRGSNHGAAMTVMAPGHEAPSTDLSGVRGANSIEGTDIGEASWFFNYAPFGGTSAAAAHVSGVAALMLAVDPSLRPRQVRTLLAKTAIPIGTLLASGAERDDEYGHGLVNAGAAARVAGRVALRKLIPTLPGFGAQDQQMAQLMLDSFMSHSSLGQAFAGQLWLHADELVKMFTADADTAEDVREQVEKLHPLLQQLVGMPTGALGNRRAYLRPVRLIIRELLLERPSPALRRALAAFRQAARQVLTSDKKLVDAVGADDKLRRQRWAPSVG